MKAREEHTSTLYTTDVRRIAQALGIEVTPAEYVELVDADGKMAGRVTIKLTRIRQLPQDGEEVLPVSRPAHECEHQVSNFMPCRVCGA